MATRLSKPAGPKPRLLGAIRECLAAGESARVQGIVLLFVSLCGFLTVSRSRAEVTWQTDSLKPVYDPSGDFYVYAPTLMHEFGKDTILACHNTEAGVIRDDIVLLQPGGGGQMTSQSVLAHGEPNRWDSFHVCDPSVLSGNFRFHGRSYRCALFYLGNNVDASRNNQVGVAFADTWAGPWHRLPGPLVAYPPRGRWGAGQPSAVYEGQGRLLLFYTKGTPKTAGYVREVDLSSADAPRLGVETALSSAALTRSDGKPDSWNNFDVAYDPARDRFWAIREQHPCPADAPRQISPSLEILSIAASDVLRPGAAWRPEGRLSPEITGHARNHNACFARTPTGALPDPNRLRILFSTSCAAENCDGRFPLWSYGLWEISGHVQPDGP